jgi:hypothetical protein
MDGRRKREIRMWTLGDGQRGTTKEKLRLAYLASLDAVDRIEARKAEALKSGKFTAAGAVDYGAVCAQRVGAVSKRGRNVIDNAKREAKRVA